MTDFEWLVISLFFLFSLLGSELKMDDDTRAWYEEEERRLKEEERKKRLK
jgi:hypothetical protein